MFKFLILLFLLAASFGAGYYVGQRPVGTLEKTVSDLSKRLAASEKLVGEVRQSVKNLSQSALDAARSIERDHRRRQGLTDAQSQLAQAKTDVVDRNYGDAAGKLAEAVKAVEQSSQASRDSAEVDALLDLAASLREARLELARGKSVPLKKFDAWQRSVEQLLDKT
ncbi:MAG: hypothetical protein NNA30_06635 [Nitrospira sp.]|nr:hypothetical protein [Nitrospira sp.]